MSHLFDVVRDLFGIGSDWAELGPVQLSARAVTLYLSALVVVRLGNERLLGKSVAFDVLLGFILGSLLCRAILGSDTLFQTVVAAGVMLGVHGLVALLAARRSTRPEPPPVAPVRALACVPRNTAPDDSEPRVVEVQVADGVQTVRIAIG